MTAAMPIDLIDERTLLLPLTVEQYHQMMSSGLIMEGEPFELLDGVVVRKDRSATGEHPMTVGHEHAWVVKKLGRLNSQIQMLGAHVQTQQPITLPPSNEPEPEAAIIAGTEDDYHDHHPTAADVLCVIEVADASLRRDRTVKQRIYAAAGHASAR